MAPALPRYQQQIVRCLYSYGLYSHGLYGQGLDSYGSSSAVLLATDLAPRAARHTAGTRTCSHKHNELALVPTSVRARKPCAASHSTKDVSWWRRFVVRARSLLPRLGHLASGGHADTPLGALFSYGL